ncbi:phosphotransferase [Paenibacillus rhizovicinus]|uniref:Phosphotransferase n=1 Tax=Paenibacillus rhizovicinus TaxID=2704463 RepID=A0A6C0NZ59_9BACL|nr:phosphotransferase [Paenibacillus rhizovicinus]QHW31507.1 phosphotransferase [Paenibacillus rhizovicinus]
MVEELMHEIIAARVLPMAVDQWSKLRGGSNSTVWALGTSDTPRLFVFKANEPEIIAAETRFYGMYQGIPLFPVIRYVDPQYRFYLYDFIAGDTDYDRKTKSQLMPELSDRIIRHYIHSEHADEFEWVEAPERIDGDLIYSRTVIGDHLSPADHELVRAIQSRRSTRLLRENLYILHGDFGVHNFLFRDGQLAGIIDPFPKIGRPLYDLLYAFCSSPDDLHLPILLQAVERAGLPPMHEQALIEDMLMAMYFRMATCLTYHSEDISRYQEAWSEWRQLQQGGEARALGS